MQPPINDQLQAIGKTIYKLRKSRNLSQEELGEKVGMFQSQISDLEAGRLDLRIMDLLALSAALNVDAAPLLAKAGVSGKLKKIKVVVEIEARDFASIAADWESEDVKVRKA